MTETGNAESGSAEEPNPHAESVLKLAAAMSRATWWSVTPTVLVGMLVAGLLLGVPGVLGALVGGAVAGLSSLATLVLMRKTAALNPYFVMAAALGGFAGKMIILLVVMTLLRDVDGLDPKALAFTMLAAILVAAAAEMVAFRRTKIPTIIPAGAKN